MFCGSAQFSVWAVGTAQMIHFILIGDDNLRSRKSIPVPDSNTPSVWHWAECQQARAAPSGARERRNGPLSHQHRINMAVNNISEWFTDGYRLVVRSV